VLDALDGDTEIVVSRYTNRVDMLSRFSKLVRGIDDADTAVATLETARCHTVAVNGASQATPVMSVPEEFITTVEAGKGRIRAIPGIEDVFQACAASGQLLHEAGRLPFTKAPGELDLRGYDHFAGPLALEADGMPTPAMA